jgi:hypothetical protein
VDAEKNPTLFNKPAAERKIGAYLDEVAKYVPPLARTMNLAMCNHWASSSSSESGRAMIATLNQLGVNGAPKGPGDTSISDISPAQYSLDSGASEAIFEFGMKASNCVQFHPYNHSADAGIKMVVDAVDPNQPSIAIMDGSVGSSSEKVAAKLGVDPADVRKIGTKWYVKGPSRAELFLHQFASTQAAYRQAGETTINVHRGIKGAGFIDKMGQEHVKGTTSAEGKGSKIYMNAAASWSCALSTAESFASSNAGVVLHKDIPSYQTFYNYQQHVTSAVNGVTKRVFEGYGESEVIVMGHETTSYKKMAGGLPGTEKIIKISGKTAQQSQVAWPTPDASVPPGFYKLVTLETGETFWVSSEEVFFCYFMAENNSAEEQRLTPNDVAQITTRNAYDLQLARVASN